MTSKGFDLDGLANWMDDAAHEQAAQGMADVTREAGLTSADTIEIALEGELDLERVTKRANEILE